jgi:hypothetical protein
MMVGIEAAIIINPAALPHKNYSWILCRTGGAGPTATGRIFTCLQKSRF